MTILALLKGPAMMALIVVLERRLFLMHLVASIAIRLSLLCTVRLKGGLQVHFEGVRVNLLGIDNIAFGALYELGVALVTHETPRRA